jgi:TRAP-type C4-dicarboxylate transport system substrate-binding protein
MAKRILVFGFLATSFFLSSCSQSSKTKTLFLAHSLPQSHPVHKGIVFFQNELDKISEGKQYLKNYYLAHYDTEKN